MIPFPRYLPDQNALAVWSIAAPFPAGSLVAKRQDDMLAVASPVTGDLICAWIPFDQWALPDGTALDTIDAAFAYLDAQCRLKRAVGETFGVAAVAGSDLARGMPLAISRATGQLVPARADTYVLAFVAGLAAVDAARGFVLQPAHGAVTLADWSAVASASTLSPGVPYFLGTSGGLTPSPDRGSAAALARVGFAASPTVLVVQPTDPVLL